MIPAADQVVDRAVASMPTIVGSGGGTPSTGFGTAGFGVGGFGLGPRFRRPIWTPDMTAAWYRRRHQLEDLKPHE